MTDVLTEIPAIPNTLLSQELQIFCPEDVLLRLLAKSPRDRPHSAEALAVYLQELLAEPSITIEAGDFDDEGIRVFHLQSCYDDYWFILRGRGNLHRCSFLVVMVMSIVERTWIVLCNPADPRNGGRD